MDVNQPLPLLGGLSAAQFMARHWQRKPLLVRQAVPGMAPLLSRSALFSLAGRDDVESRLVEQQTAKSPATWKMRRGPFGARALPPLKRAGWSLLVQGVDQHDDAVHALMNRFRFVPDARLDDVMISFATDGGGVGPHFDSYDVFLLQVQGRRRWRVSRQADLSLQEGVPLKILADFRPEEEWVLEPGDMLYLPPRYAHDGVAEGECMTYSIGFRAPAREELARELLLRAMDEPQDEDGQPVPPVLYRDARQPAVGAPAEIPAQLSAFARDAVERALAVPGALDRALGEYLTEPKANVWFDIAPLPRGSGGVALDRRSRMMYDAHRIYINGESYLASGRDATLMRRLADQRMLDAKALARASAGAVDLIGQWHDDGWLHDLPETPDDNTV